MVRARRPLSSSLFICGSIFLVVPALAHAQTDFPHGLDQPQPPPPGWAQVAVDDAEIDREAARAVFDRAVEVFDSGDLPRALALFQRSYEMFPTAVALYNVGACQEQLGDRAGALASFRRYLEAFSATAAESDVADVRARVADIEWAIAADAAAEAAETYSLPAQAAGGTGTPGAPSRVGAQERDAFPRVGAETAGPAGGSPSGGARADAPAAYAVWPAPEPGAVWVRTSVPEATVQVDGVELGRGNVDAELAPGSHDLLVMAPGYRDYRTRIEVHPGERATVPVVMTPEASDAGEHAQESDSYWWAYVLGVVAVVSCLAAGVVVTLNY